jgi:hypothetical protein
MKKQKQLLNESEIRKMMKFANLQPLSENFIDKLEEEDITEADEDPLDMPEPGAEEPEAADPVEDPVLDEPVPDEELGDEVSADVTISTEQANALVELLNQIEAAMPGDDAEELEDPMAPEDEEAAMAPSPEMPPPEDEMVAEEEEYKEGIYESKKTAGQEDLVSEVARRVAKRLMAAKG